MAETRPEFVGKSEAYIDGYLSMEARLAVQDRDRKAGRAPAVRQDAQPTSTRADFRTGEQAGEFRQDAADAPAPKLSGAAAARRRFLTTNGMRPEAADHRMGLTDRSGQVRQDGDVIAAHEAAAEARRVDRERALKADRDRRARYDADAQRRLDAALISINRPAPPPAGYAPPSGYQHSAAATARTRLQVRGEMGVTGHPDVRTDQQAGSSASAADARRRLHQGAR